MQLPLPEQFTEYFSDYRSSVVKNLLITAASIFSAQTTNLNRAKDKVGRIIGKTKTKPSSNYKRLLRFFQNGDKRDLIKDLLSVCFCLLEGQKQLRYLTLDGTVWEIGEKKVHVLVLCVIYGGVSIPIWWEELDKKGTSNFRERKRVIRQACKFLDLSGLVLLADREYIGRDWFKYLKNKKIDFVVRLKQNGYKDEVDQASLKAKPGDYFQKARYIKLQRLAEFRRYRRCGVAKKIKMGRYCFTFVVFKNPKQGADEPLLYFLSSLTDKRQIIKAYPLRWTIECCFRHLKSNGFRLEEMGLKQPLKIMLMIAVVVFLYVLCICEGLKQLSKPKSSDRRIFKNGVNTLAISVFRKGLSYVCLRFHDLISFIRYLEQILDRKKLLFLQNVQ